jgi:hypothetical protein
MKSIQSSMGVRARGGDVREGGSFVNGFELIHRSVDGKGRRMDAKTVADECLGRLGGKVTHRGGTSRSMACLSDGARNRGVDEGALVERDGVDADAVNGLFEVQVQMISDEAGGVGAEAGGPK